MALPRLLFIVHQASDYITCACDSRIWNLLVLRKLPPSDYRNHRTVWSPGGKNRRIFVVCGIQRFDDNSDLILRPQSRISWIISPQCIIIIGVVVFVTVESQSPPVSSLEDLGIIAARTR